MERLALFCVIFVVFIGLTSGAGVLPKDSVDAAVGGSVDFTTSLAAVQPHLESITWQFGGSTVANSVGGGILIPPLYRNRVTLFTSTGSLEFKNVTLNDSGVYTVSITPTADDNPLPGTITLAVYVPPSNVTMTANSTDLLESISSVSLSCSASGSSLSFLWFKNGAGVTAGDRVEITDGGATLIISPVMRSDHGSYTCKVSNPVDSITSEQTNLTVSYGPDPPIVTITPEGEHHEEGSTVSLTCSADSRPVAAYEWLLNGVVTAPGNETNLVNIQMSERGNYSCRASNSKTGKQSTSELVPISVWQKITNIETESPSAQPVEGLSLNLTCDAAGTILTREWTINGIEIEPSDNIVFYDENQVLSFKVLNRKDAGKYTCTISNPISSLKDEYEVKVNYGPDDVQVPYEVKVNEGTTLKVSCSADSVPTAKYTWMKDGTTVGQSQEYTKENVQKTDAGNYTCQAENDITGKTSKGLCSVIVTGPVSDPDPPYYIIGIVLGCLIIILVAGGGFYVYKKKKLQARSNTRTDGEGRDNSAFAEPQEPNYADVRFVKKDGEVVELGVKNNNTVYSEVRNDTNPPASRLPSYDAHMQRGRRPAPEPPTEYTEVRRK